MFFNPLNFTLLPFCNADGIRKLFFFPDISLFACGKSQKVQKHFNYCFIFYFNESYGYHYKYCWNAHNSSKPQGGYCKQNKTNCPSANKQKELPVSKK